MSVRPSSHCAPAAERPISFFSLFSSSSSSASARHAANQQREQQQREQQRREADEDMLLIREHLERTGGAHTLLTVGGERPRVIDTRCFPCGGGGGHAW